MKAWRIIRAILFAVFAVICLFAGFFDFKYGEMHQKVGYVVFVVGLVLFLPGLIKDIASPYEGKKEPKKFVRRRLLFSMASSALFAIGVYILLAHSPNGLAVLEQQMGIHGFWIPFTFFVIFMFCHLVLDLLIFYLPRRLGLDGEPESEAEEQKDSRLALVITAVVILLTIICTFL